MCLSPLQTQFEGLNKWMDEMDVFLHADDPAAGDIPALQAQLQESKASCFFLLFGLYIHGAFSLYIYVVCLISLAFIFSLFPILFSLYIHVVFFLLFGLLYIFYTSIFCLCDVHADFVLSYYLSSCFFFLSFFFVLLFNLSLASSLALCSCFLPLLLVLIILFSLFSVFILQYSLFLNFILLFSLFLIFILLFFLTCLGASIFALFGHMLYPALFVFKLPHSPLIFKL